MSFTWKANGQIFKGEGIYHLTFAVVNRAPILGKLEPLSEPDAEGHTVEVRATELGRAVLAKMNELKARHPELQIIWKELMPDHLHVLIWMHEGFEGSIKMVARGYSQGCSTYTAAINAGEKAVAKALREAGFPLVVMMLKGFPPEGTEAARYFHPGMVYHQACGEGRLFLLAPHTDNYINPELIARTEATLRLKAEAKGHHYLPIPHTSTRWLMIAGNEMLRMIAGE